ncbi:MAG: GAF domain-containing protein [Solirubrobacteraceae bacterium]
MTRNSATRGAWAPERLRDDLERLALHTPIRADFFDEAAARLKRTVPFGGACWHTLDPGSDLITQHRLQDLPDRFPILAHNEYAVEDVNKFAQLARAERKAATINDATGDDPQRSARFRDLLTPAGLGPELRSAFVADGTTWGALILVRRAGEPDFTHSDTELLASLSPLFARAVRRG